MAVAIFVVNSFASPYFLDSWSLSDLTFNFTEKALIALAMALLIISGEIDLSVAAIIALASTLMGMAVQAGAGTPVLVAIGIGAGSPAAPSTALLVTRLGLPSIVVTIGTMSLFRGIAFIILGDQAYKGYPASFAFFGQGYVWWVISFELVLFLVAALVYGFLLHRTSFGRRVFAIGNNPIAAQILRRPGRPHQIHPVLPDRPDGGHRLGADHLAARLDAALDRPGLRTGGNHHGGARRRQHPRRRRQHPRRRARRLHHGPGDVRARPAQRARHRHVDLHRPAAHRRHRAADHLGPRLSGRCLMAEKYAFRMKLNPGMKAEYSKRHDAIWPELVALLKEAGVSDYSIHLDEETNMLFGVLWRRDGPRHGRTAEASGDAALVGAYGRHHGDKARQRAGGGAAGNRVPYGVTMAAVRHVAVIDIGKTNAKVALVDLERCAEIARAQDAEHACSRDGPYPHIDTERLWASFSTASARSSANSGSMRSP